MKKLFLLLAACTPHRPAHVDPDAALDPCACTTPPPAVCADSITLRTFLLPATCSGGACNYAASDAACLAPAHATARCEAAACEFACEPGYDRVADHCESAYQVPTGTLHLAGTCTYAHRGWHLGQADECVRDTSTGAGAATRAVTIMQVPDGHAFTTTLQVDPLTGRPYDPYTIELGPMHLTATKDMPQCDPIYGTCVTHVWALAPHALHLVTSSLHDNDSQTPLGQCWEYHYDRSDCAFDLTW